jgi:5-methylcytosine-specific restriction endonuclease McrA
MPRLNRSWTKNELRAIYDNTCGYCSLCHIKLSLINYNARGRRAAWHVEHTVPIALGGTNRLGNLKPACIDCNLDKGICTARAARARNGLTRAPYSRSRVATLRKRNTWGGIAAGAGTGAAVGGPFGAVVGALFGGLFGNNLKVK